MKITRAHIALAVVLLLVVLMIIGRFLSQVG